MRTAFDCDGLMDDVTLNARGGRQAHLKAANGAHDAAIDDNVVRHAFAVHRRTFADRKKMRADVAIHGTFDLNITRCLKISGDMQVR